MLYGSQQSQFILSKNLVQQDDNADLSIETERRDHEESLKFIDKEKRKLHSLNNSVSIYPTEYVETEIYNENEDNISIKMSEGVLPDYVQSTWLSDNKSFATGGRPSTNSHDSNSYVWKI